MPLGIYDADLLEPTLVWIRRMMKKKIERINQSKRGVNSQNSMNNNKRDQDEAKDEVEKSDDHCVDDRLLYVIGFEEKFDPFKKTGRMFGSLLKEIKHRYSKYVSDLTDGLNLNCFIAFVFVFTLCIAPALCFGGILGKVCLRFTVNFR